MSVARSIWVDDRDPIYRRGIVACLQAEGYSIAGESAGLRPELDLSRSSVLLFEADAEAIDRAGALARRWDVRLVGLVCEARGRLRGLRMAGLSGVLVPRALTPSQLLSCVRAVSEAGGPRPVPAGDLTRREFDVLRLLADGDTTRDIAKRLSYSERTVKNIVHDLLAKLNCRTRAHAVALAARRGVI